MSAKPLNVLDIDTEVKFVDSDGEGRVIEICVHPQYAISYKVVYWQGGSRKAEWVGSAEVEAKPNAKPLKIGFVQPE